MGPLRRVPAGGVPEPVERVAVCVYDFPSLGDQLVLLPLYDGIRRRFPGCRILTASRYPLARLAEQHGFVDETLIYRRAGWRLLRAVARFDPQVAICLRRSSPGANLCFSRWSGARRSGGYAGGAARLWHTHLGAYREHVYRPRRLLTPLEALGGAGDLPGTVRRLARSASRKRERRPCGVIVPGGAIDEKLWGAERFAAVAAALGDEHPELRWVAVLGRKELARRDDAVLAAGLPGLEVVAEAGLDELARQFLDARLVLANDCGPAHLAQMGGVPLVQTFGNWDGEAPERIGWWYDPRPGAVCLTTRAPAAITAIGSEAMLAAAGELLADPEAGGVVRYVDEPVPDGDGRRRPDEEVDES